MSNTFSSIRYNLKNEIAKRLNRISEEDFEGNDSAMARKFDITPQSLYRYLKRKRTPGAKFLSLLAEKGYNLNWVLLGDGDMHMNGTPADKVDQPRADDFIKEEGVAKMLDMIIQRLAEVDYNEEVKMQILKETLSRIVIAQNDHFVEKQLNKM